MTREEAIASYEKLYAYMVGDDDAIELDYGEFMELNHYIRSALRPVSREKVWRGEWNYSHTTETDHFAVVKCSKCGHEAFAIALYVKDGNFCPACGAPMTDEAVEMVMERLEGFHGQENP